MFSRKNRKKVKEMETGMLEPGGLEHGHYHNYHSLLHLHGFLFQVQKTSRLRHVRFCLYLIQTHRSPWSVAFVGRAPSCLPLPIAGRDIHAVKQTLKTKYCSVVRDDCFQFFWPWCVFCFVKSTGFWGSRCK